MNVPMILSLCSSILRISSWADLCSHVPDNHAAPEIPIACARRIPKFEDMFYLWKVNPKEEGLENAWSCGLQKKACILRRRPTLLIDIHQNSMGAWVQYPKADGGWYEWLNDIVAPD